MASLKLEKLNKVYPSGITALYDINFEAEDKEFIVVLGADGSGKSTLIRTIAGLEDATSGSIYIDDKDVAFVNPKERDIAFVFRGGALNQSVNVYENLAYGLKLRKAPAALIEKRIKTVANMLDIESLLTKKIKTLTAAQKVRVTIGRALVREPRLYLFDEPLSGLDSNLQDEILRLVINLQARMSGSFLYATKDVSEALTIGTRIIVMKDGLIQQIDTPANLYDYPANAYVAFYIGSPTINFVHNAHILKDGEDYYAVLGELKWHLAENIVKRFENIDEYAGSEKKVLLGIRPEDITLGEGIAVTCEYSEDEYVSLAVNKELSLVAASKKNLQKGEKAELKVDETRLYIFDEKTRLTLLSRDSNYKNTGRKDADYKPLPLDEENAITKNSPSDKAGKKR